MCRTFSKIHWLAALRLGWLYCTAHVVDAINRIRGPFNVNAAAMAAGVAAIGDTTQVEAARAHNDVWLAWLTEQIGKLGLEVTPSVANFVLIHFPATKGHTAEEADAFLTRRGLILRRLDRACSARSACRAGHYGDRAIGGNAPTGCRAWPRQSGCRDQCGGGPRRGPR